MASRSSANYMSEYYIGTRKGRTTDGDISYEMFPEKYESSEGLLFEDPEELHDDRRETLKDFTPDNNTMFASDEPRRNPGSAFRLNLREYGAPGSGTDPWQNDEVDTQFHDADPRGYLTEQPWNEYRRHLEAQLRRIDFKDDGDYSVTGGGIHPNTMYKNIRSAQNWVKDRLKIFSTSFEGRSNGGVGVYDNVSEVFKSDFEDSSVLTDGTGMARTFEDPVVRQRITTRLSNILHGGSAALRANTTTDHRVKVASYGKLYSQRGLIPFESQLRITEDDTPYSQMEKAQGVVPKNLVRMMASSADPSKENMTATAANRHDRQKSGKDAKLTDRDLTLENRNNMVTGDILALLGITENEVKWLESYRNQDRKTADQMLANIYEMAEVVHRMPMHAKLQAREGLLLSAAGGHLSAADASQIRKTRDQVIVNPKFIEFMYSVVSKGKDLSGNEFMTNKWNAIPDAEGRQEINNPTKSTPIFVSKNQAKGVEKITDMMWKGSKHDKRAEKANDKRVHSYTNLRREASIVSQNRKDTRVEQEFKDSDYLPSGKHQNPGVYDPNELMREAEGDRHFYQSLAHTRHGGTKMSGKSGVRRNIELSGYSYDKNSELGLQDLVSDTGSGRKNPKNRS